MPMHLDDERMQRLLHDELEPPARAVVLEHLETCDACRAGLEAEARAEQRLLTTLQAIDTPPPLRMPHFDARPRTSRRWLAQLVASIGGLAIAGIAFAAPGSPLPGLLRRVTQSTPTVSAPSPPPAVEPPTDAGIAVTPGRRLAIDVAPGSGAAVATISLTDSREVILRAVGGRPSFSAGVDRVAIRNVEGITALFIDIPRTAPHVDLRVDGTRVLVKDGPEIATAARRDGAGRYALPLAP
jgi:anti-sigma factor RsiW